MNPRIKKINAELSKIVTKRADYRERIQELDEREKTLTEERTDLENTEIIGLVRSVNMTPDELAVLIQNRSVLPIAAPEEDTPDEPAEFTDTPTEQEDSGDETD